MLKYQIIRDVFLLCAAFSVLAVILYRLAGGRREHGGAVARLGVFDLLGAGGIFLLYFFFHAQSAVADPDSVRITWPVVVASMMVQLVIGGVILALLAPRVSLVDYFGLRWSGWRWVFLIAPAGVVATWVFAGVLEATQYVKWVEGLLHESTLQESVLILQKTNDPVLLVVMVVAVVVVAPVVEELIFRGYLFPVLKRFTDVGFGAVMSGLIFAAAHGELAALPVLFFLGVVLALIYERTGSIWAPIAVHALFNSLTVLASLAMRWSPAGSP